MPREMVPGEGGDNPGYGWKIWSVGAPRGPNGMPRCFNRLKRVEYSGILSP